MKDEFSIIVDENDKIVGYKKRDDITSKDIYRVTALWIINSKNEILLTHRSETKKNDPDKWQPAVAGTVENNESYLENIIKETKEEIGLTITEQDIIPLEKVLIEGKWNFFLQRYLLRKDIELTSLKMEDGDVKGIQWMRFEEIDKILDTNPEYFVSSFPKIIKILKEYVKK